MKIIIECSVIGLSCLVEAVKNKINECVKHYENSEWEQFKRICCAQEFSLHDILAQIVEQVNGGQENDG